MRKRNLVVFLALFATLAVAGDKGFTPPAAAHAKTYPLSEAHDDEQVSIAIDPYNEQPKAAVFRNKYGENGFLVFRLIISNDSAKTLMLDSLKVRYLTGHHDSLEPATANDIFRRLAHMPRPDRRPPVQLPVPPSHKPRSTISKETQEEVASALFVPVPVTPRSTNSGFLFFDVQDISDPKAGAHLYVSGIKAGTQELFYFDIPLDQLPPSSSAQPSPR
jgi:hypothetical protein